jgi:hypothetical protein
VRLLSWNIEHGGGARATRIVDAIVAHNPNVIALSEFRAKPGAGICAALATQGWWYVESTNPAVTYCRIPIPKTSIPITNPFRVPAFSSPTAGPPLTKESALHGSTAV